MLLPNIAKVVAGSCHPTTLDQQCLAAGEGEMRPAGHAGGDLCHLFALETIHAWRSFELAWPATVL